MKRTTALALAGSAVLFALPFGARADAPPVLAGPDARWTTSGTVTDPHVQAVCAEDPSAPLPIAEAVCPTYTIVLDAPDDRPLHYLDVRLDMAPLVGGRTADDYDVYLYDANGTEVTNSASALGSSEVLSVNFIPDGTYTVKVIPYTNVPDSTFTLSARYRTAAR